MKKFKKMVGMLTLCGVMMFGSSITAFAGGGDEIDEPMTDPIFTPVIEQEKEEPEVTETPKEPVAFTPDGNAQLVDEATDEDEKLFYTFVTKNDNYFYLVIDKARDTDNVYMLNMIDEQDLMALIAEQEGNDTAGADTGKDSEITLKPEAGVTVTPEPEEPSTEVEPTPEEPKKQTNSGTTLLLVLLILGGGGAGVFYYLKFVKGKNENFSLEDDLDFYDDEDYESEDEVEESDDADTSDDAEDEEVGDIEEDI